MTYVIQPPAQPSVPVVGTEARFPVHRIYCVGRNYAAHAREMGSDPSREPPFFFCKPADAVTSAANGETLQLPYPAETQNYHYEVEMVVALAKGGSNIAPEDALSHVFGYGIGLDMTRRDLQGRMKDGGRPWEIGKAFEQSAPMAAIYPVSAVGHPENAEIWLHVNGVEKQRGNINDLIWPVADVISYLSRFFTLQPGDLIMTGTPEGVGPVVAGDTLRGHIEGLGELQVQII